jgi:GWxTD domain-containing protein
MFTPTLGIRAATAFAALALVAGAATAPAAAAVRADDKPEKKKQKRELDDVYKRWLKEDVVYIISPEEREAFERLATDEEREQFMEQFWLRRDPDPDTPDNPVREEHYRRIAYANEHFTSGKPGWRTDRGRMYIAWGKPDETESYPTGQVYDRPQWQGGGSTTTYAYEVWWYRHLDGVGDDIEIEFVDPSGSGEYRMADSPYEKDALLYVGNAGATEWEQLGLANRTDRPAYGGSGGRYYNPPANKTQFAILETQAKLFKGPGDNVKLDNGGVSFDDPRVEENALPFAVRTDFYRVSESDVATALTLQIDHKDLAFENSGGIYMATVNVSARLKQLSGKTAGSFQEVITTPRYGEDNFALGQQQKSAFQKNILLPPGRYKIDVVARDTTSGKTGIITKSFVVPRFEENKLATSSVVLASKIEEAGNRVTQPQFIIGKFKVIPNVSNVYRVGQPIQVFMQVYDAGMDATTLKPTVDVEYVLLKDGKEIKRIARTDSDKLYDLAGSQIALGEIIPSDALAPGSYTLQVRVTDRVAGKTLTPETEVTITP